MSKTDISLAESLAKLVNDQNLAEIEYDTEGLRLRVVRTAATAFAPAPVAMPAPVAAPAAAPAATAAPAAEEDKGEADKSPMCGVMYASPEPHAAPYVSVGDTVAADQTLFLVEAMKTFNPVKAPRAGKVVKILVTDRSPVEYGEPLLILE